MNSPGWILYANRHNDKVIQVYEIFGKWLDEKRIRLILGDESTEDKILKRGRDASIYLAYKQTVTRRIMEGLPNLELVMSSGNGYEHIDVEAATELGIPVTHVPTYNVVDVAEHSLSLILAMAVQLPELIQCVKSGGWECGARVGIRHRFPGQVLGLVGFGRIGRKVAELGHSLNFQIVAYDPYVEAKVMENWGVESCSLEDLLQGSDIISLHSLVTRETRHLIGKRELELMKPAAALVNTSRGALVDESALVEALEKGELSRAALDVLEKEPPDPSNPLLKMNNVLVTGHGAGTSKEGIEAWQQGWKDVVEAWMEGLFPPNVVNPEVESKSALKRR